MKVSNILAVPTMLRPSRNRPRTLFAHFLRKSSITRTSMRTERLRRQRNIATFQLRRGNQLTLALIPRREDLGRGRTPQNTRVNKPCEFDMREVAGGAVDAFKIPDGLGPMLIATPESAMRW